MATKLVSANMGIILVVERDGKQETVQWSTVVPSHNVPQPHDALFYLEQYLSETFDMDIQQHVPVAKPKRIKASRPVSQKEFNRKIKELGYEEK